MTSRRRCRRLALLIGSNPLPNYVAAAVLEPKETVLLYSPQTRNVSRRLRTALQRMGIGAIEHCVEDPTDARKVRDACGAVEFDHLHYSGGTKTMAAHAVSSCDLGDGQRSYLDERRGLLRFDDGYDRVLSEVEIQQIQLTLDVPLDLHDIERRTTGRGDDPAGRPTEEDVRVMAQGVLSRPELASEIYEKLRPDGKRPGVTKAQGKPWLPREANLALGVEEVPGRDWNRDRYKAWDEFLTGGWLERWSAKQVRSCLGTSVQELEVSAECVRRADGRDVQFEIDVAVLRGHRLHVFSCTAETRKALCKSKLLEVAMRSRQMGGDLARCALVCLLGGSDERGSYVEQLRADFAAVWDAPNMPAVFGLEDLREWAGTGGEANLSTWKEWLES